MGRRVQQSPADRAIGHIPPAEAEERYYALLDEHNWQHDSKQTASGSPGTVHFMFLGSSESMSNSISKTFDGVQA
jgi:hypothetical protein